MRKHYICIILAVVLFLLGLFLLYVPSVVGLADNTDFIRITQPTGMISDNNLKFFYFQRKFEYIRSFDNLGDFFKFVLCPDVKNESNFKSTQFLFVKIAQLISGVILYFNTKVINYFDIVALSAVFLSLHSISVAFLFKSLKTGKRACDFFILLLMVLIFYDMGYLLYYNSLFGESVILSSFLLWFSVLVYLVKNENKSYLMLIIDFISSVIFTGAKVANIPLGFLIGVFSIHFLFNVESVGKKILIVFGICIVFATSVYFYRAIPDWMKKPNNYHSIFFGILKNSDNPERDLVKLGIDTKYSSLANTNVYVNLKGFDIYSEEFHKEVYDRAGPVEVSLYYLKNPERMLERLNLSAEASLFIRPPYLGNYQLESDTEIVKFANRNSVWEWIRKQFTGYAFALVIFVFSLYLSIIIYENILSKKHKGHSHCQFIPGKILLMIFAASQWIFPVIGNGEADLIKHMFLFNLLFDTMIIILVADIIKLTRKKLISRQIVFSLLGFLVISTILIIADREISNNRLIVFGKYKQKPITWEVLKETRTHYFVIAKNIVDYRAFSSESNYWMESDLRMWLNDDSANGFLFEFSESEKKRIEPVVRKTLLSPAFKDSKELGSQPHYWFCIPGFVTQNYDDAYQTENKERVFLLSVKEWEEYDFKKRKGVQYWLRTPYTMDSTVRVVGEDGFVYHKRAGMKSIGVLPALIIKK